MSALALLCGALLAACNGDAPSPPPTATTQPPSATPQRSATPDPILSTEIDGDRIYEHVRMLSEEIGPRPAGTPNELRSRDYIRDELASYGYDVTLQEFEFDATQFLPARIDAGDARINAVILVGSGSGIVTGPLTDVAAGRPEDFPVAGIAGGIALIDRGGFELGTKARNAIATGATGVIIVNDGPRVPLASLGGQLDIPVVGVTQPDGDILRGLIAGGAASVTITVTEPRGTAWNVVAKPPGITTCATVTGGHHDSVPVTGGADDNASGTAAVIEIARVAAARDLPGAHCYVLFGAEEYGLLGSEHYVSQLSDTDRNAIRAMINLDVIGFGDDLQLIGSEDTVEVARVAAEAENIDTEIARGPQGGGSDHQSFEDAGIPVVFFYREDNLIHTQQDAIDRINPEHLEETARIAYATLEALGG